MRGVFGRERVLKKCLVCLVGR